MKKYTIGIDFGSLSGRCVLVDLETGREASTAVCEYAHKVMDTSLPDGTPLQIGWALQHPQDYLEVLRTTVREVIEQANIQPQQIIGVGVDFTSCTVLPIMMDGTPLCFLKEYEHNPHAYVKLWKHHAAQQEADDLNRIAAERGEPFLARYGNKISSEWLFPKLWQILREAPDVYEKMDCFIEATDWIVMQLTGKMIRNTCSAGYKAIWNKKEGYPSKQFFKALDPRLENVVEEKLKGTIQSIGTKAGEITPEAAELTGLCEHTAVAVAHLDAAGSMVGAGITESGTMLAVMGTSTCHMLIGDSEHNVPGICGWVEDGLIPGKIGYEAGQSCVGDHFQWFIENCISAEYGEDAKRAGKNIFQYLSTLAAKKLPGETGLVALDWWNGNRSVLVDGELSGVLVGCTLQTKPEDIYRALVEATAYGTRKIIETCTTNGVDIHTLVAAGGIAQKDPFLMQIYADIVGMDILIAGSSQNPALSSAIWGSLAAGSDRGGFDDLTEAVKVLSNQKDTVYHPIPENKKVYDQLYYEYELLHDYFGRGQNNVMKRLKKIMKIQKEKQFI